MEEAKTVEKMYVGLDLGRKAGVSVFIPAGKTAWVFEVEDEPIEQCQRVLRIIDSFWFAGETHVAIEELHSFRNAKTTRSLLERAGYVRYTLIGNKFEVRMVSNARARKWIGAKNKEEVFSFFKELSGYPLLTDNMSDALLLSCYMAHMKKEDEEIPEQIIGGRE